MLLDEGTHVIVDRRHVLILRRLYILHDHLFPLEFFFQNLSLVRLLLLESLGSQVNNFYINLSFLLFLLALLN